MLSGIGPSSHLKEAVIQVKVHLPVDKNLYNHVVVPLVFIMSPESDYYSSTLNTVDSHTHIIISYNTIYGEVDLFL